MKQRTTPTAKRNYGFTLMEMLIVVAIIAVLVAVAIPTFSSQLHKARVATDWANVRSYYAQLQYDFMETGKINNTYLNEFDFLTSFPPGRTSFNLSGQEITLKEGSIAVRKNDDEGTTGYNILYLCNENHGECQLVLPMSGPH
ncbi:type IV pilin protein [uncultured Dysosmobacter sp.]|uniref:type IV pilin protein n=1 Tax=uncultured Dysosmobacter sp. TaxID=2591384 RepID=UPI0026732ABB|nr:prepilin-type N-terminal cleavage/methylation domain-containing protein [uncultured Dysosmobacter sp.]